MNPIQSWQVISKLIKIIRIQKEYAVMNKFEATADSLRWQWNSTSYNIVWPFFFRRSPSSEVVAHIAQYSLLKAISWHEIFITFENYSKCPSS